jgi:hypothetical protein
VHVMLLCVPGCRALDLHSNNLSGTIPDGISALTSLTCVMCMGAMLSTAAVAVLLCAYFTCRGGKSGVYSVECGMCMHPAMCVCPPGPGCRGLYLYSNSLSGTVPASISALSSLQCVEATCPMHCPLLPTAAGTAVLLVLIASHIADV